MTETSIETTTAKAKKAKDAFETASRAAMHLRDAISAVALLVHDRWHGAITPDRARNALDWISQKMDQDCDALHDALDVLKPVVRP